MYGNNLDTESQTNENKQKEQLQLLLIIAIVGIGYYFFAHLPQKREKAKEEINKLFQQNSSIVATDLNANLWKDAENWEEYLDSLYLSSQLNLFVREMRKEIIRLAEEEKEKPKKAIANPIPHQW